MKTLVECPICSGSGWKTISVPGKGDRAVRCECRVNARAERLIKSARIPARYEHCTLEDFSTDFEGASPSLAEAHLAAECFVREYPIETTGLLIVGPIGTGKTHLAAGIVQELIRTKGIPCLFCDYRELLKQILHSYNPKVKTTELEVLRPVFDAEILVLDELGAVKPTQWVWDTVSYVINYRYNEKKTTIITTNFPDLPAGANVAAHRGFSQQELAKSAASKETLGDRITDRMRSRLHEMCRIVAVDGIDFRTGPKSATKRYRIR